MAHILLTPQPVHNSVDNYHAPLWCCVQPVDNSELSASVDNSVDKCLSVGICS